MYVFKRAPCVTPWRTWLCCMLTSAIEAHVTLAPPHSSLLCFGHPLQIAFVPSPCHALHAQTFFRVSERSESSSHSRHDFRLRPYHHPQNTLAQTQTWQPCIHISSIPCPALSCLSPAVPKKPLQNLSQRTSLRLAPHCRAEDWQWHSQP